MDHSIIRKSANYHYYFNIINVLMFYFHVNMQVCGSDILDIYDNVDQIR